MSSKIDLLNRWKEVITESSTLIDPVVDILGCHPENPISDAVYLLQSEFTKVVAASVGDDAEWLDWFWLENEFGKRGFEAGFGENLRPIKNIEDLVWLIENCGKLQP